LRCQGIDGFALPLFTIIVFGCVRIAATALLDLTPGARIRCRTTGETRNQCAIAVCDADGYDLSQGMMYTGWALAKPVTGASYKPFEETAQKNRHGLWAGQFRKPWNWRREGKKRGITGN